MRVSTIVAFSALLFGASAAAVSQPPDSHLFKREAAVTHVGRIRVESLTRKNLIGYIQDNFVSKDNAIDNEFGFGGLTTTKSKALKVKFEARPTKATSEITLTALTKKIGRKPITAVMLLEDGEGDNFPQAGSDEYGGLYVGIRDDSPLQDKIFTYIPKTRQFRIAFQGPNGEQGPVTPVLTSDRKIEQESLVIAADFAKYKELSKKYTKVRQVKLVFEATD